MKAKLWIDGKEFEVDVSEEQLQALTETKKKTGYERVEKGSKYHTAYASGTSGQLDELYTALCDCTYENANYYSDETVAANNARADKLYRQLRRFAVKHRKEEPDWDNGATKKYYIYYDYYNAELFITRSWGYKGFGVLYFDSRETAQLAIDTFKDELLWYFTEYKDSL